MENVILNWKDELNFVAADPSMECNLLSPKSKMLYAAAQCAGMASMMIVSKMKIPIESFSVEINATLSQTTIASQSVFTSFALRYTVTCDDQKAHPRLSDAVEMAHNKYCGMMRMLRMIAPVSFDIYVRIPRLDTVDEESLER